MAKGSCRIVLGLSDMASVASKEQVAAAVEKAKADLRRAIEKEGSRVDSFKFTNTDGGDLVVWCFFTERDPRGWRPPRFLMPRQTKGFRWRLLMFTAWLEWLWTGLRFRGAREFARRLGAGH